MTEIRSVTNWWEIAVDLEVLEQFTQPTTDHNEEQVLLQQFGLEIPEPYPVGLVIGRFQPLHYGHLYLMKQALRVAKHIVVGIGSSNVHNIDNPFSAEMREQMIRSALEHETAIKQGLFGIVQIPDHNDDNLWLTEVLNRVGRPDVVVGNNNWVNGIVRSAGIAAMEIPLLQRGIYEGKKIRAALRGEITS